MESSGEQMALRCRMYTNHNQPVPFEKTGKPSVGMKSVAAYITGVQVAETDMV